LSIEYLTFDPYDVPFLEHQPRKYHFWYNDVPLLEHHTQVRISQDRSGVGVSSLE